MTRLGLALIMVSGAAQVLAKDGAAEVAAGGVPVRPERRASSAGLGCDVSVGCAGRDWTQRFATVAEVETWTARYTGCCGCGKPVVLKHGSKEVVAVVCLRTSGPVTSQTYVFEKRRQGYAFMLLRDVIYRHVEIEDAGEQVLFKSRGGPASPEAETLLFTIPWSGVALDDSP